MRAEVQYLHARVGGEVTGVGDHGRRVTVLTDDGETIDFALRGATGRFQAAGDGPKLKLLR
jgi:hypothetical protein